MENFYKNSTLFFFFFKDEILFKIRIIAEYINIYSFLNEFCVMIFAMNYRCMERNHVAIYATNIFLMVKSILLKKTFMD